MYKIYDHYENMIMYLYFIIYYLIYYFNTFVKLVIHKKYIFKVLQDSYFN